MTKELPIQEILCEHHGEACMCPYCTTTLKAIGEKYAREEVAFISETMYKKVFYQTVYE